MFLFSRHWSIFYFFGVKRKTLSWPTVLFFYFIFLLEPSSERSILPGDASLKTFSRYFTRSDTLFFFHTHAFLVLSSLKSWTADFFFFFLKYINSLSDLRGWKVENGWMSANGRTRRRRARAFGQKCAHVVTRLDVNQQRGKHQFFEGSPAHCGHRHLAASRRQKRKHPSGLRIPPSAPPPTPCWRVLFVAFGPLEARTPRRSARLTWCRCEAKNPAASPSRPPTSRDRRDGRRTVADVNARYRQVQTNNLEVVRN